MDYEDKARLIHYLAELRKFHIAGYCEAVKYAYPNGSFKYWNVGNGYSRFSHEQHEQLINEISNVETLLQKEEFQDNRMA